MKYAARRLIFTNPLYADGDDLRWNSNPNPCQLANVTSKTRDKGQWEKSRISCHCRDKETADRQTVAQENHGQTMSKMSRISDLKRPTAPKNTEQQNIMMQRTANENAACLHRICNIRKQAAFSFAVLCIIMFCCLKSFAVKYISDSV